MNVKHCIARALCFLCVSLCVASPLTIHAVNISRSGTIATEVYTADGVFLGQANSPASFTLVDKQPSSPFRGIPSGSTLALYVPTAFTFAGKTYRANTRSDVTMTNLLHAGSVVTLWSGVNREGTECVVDLAEAENVYHVTWTNQITYGSTNDPYALIFELAQYGTTHITGEQLRLRVTLAITTEDLLNAIQAIDDRLAAQQAAEEDAATEAAGSLPNAANLLAAGQLAGNDESAFRSAIESFGEVTDVVRGIRVDTSVNWWQDMDGHFYLWMIGAPVVSVVLAALFHIKKEIGHDE